MVMKRAKVTSVPGCLVRFTVATTWRRTRNDQTKNLGGSFRLPGTAMTLNRIGYGAMQLAGPGVWGPTGDVDLAIAVLREAIASGVNHVDTNYLSILLCSAFTIARYS